MECGNCKYNDGLVYTSIPPKYKCIITNEFHLAFDDCDVEFVPVRHGRWIRVEDPRYATDREGGLEDAGVSYHCSECGHVGWGSENYCPICGARMDEVGQL